MASGTESDTRRSDGFPRRVSRHNDAAPTECILISLLSPVERSWCMRWPHPPMRGTATIVCCAAGVIRYAIGVNVAWLLHSDGVRTRLVGERVFVYVTAAILFAGSAFLACPGYNAHASAVLVLGHKYRANASFARLNFSLCVRGVVGSASRRSVFGKMGRIS
jgi:hypothetical protein